MPFLKAQMHIHTSEDYFDGPHISYSAEGFILLAREYNYNFISITNHDTMFNRSKLLSLRDYAAQNGIIYIPGVEKRLHNKDILLYFDYTVDAQEILKKIHSLDDIRNFRRSGQIRLVIIPHPFFHFHSMGRVIDDYLDMIDAIEFNWFYTSKTYFNPHSFITAFWLNMNTHGIEYAKKYNFPLVANGDLHKLDWFDKDYTLIKCDPTLEAFYRTFTDIKRRNLSFNELQSIITIKTTPLTYPAFKKEIVKIIRHLFKHYCKHPSHFFTYPFK